MPTREQQTNVRRFTAGALAGEFHIPCNMNCMADIPARHDICTLYLSIGRHTRPHSIQHQRQPTTGLPLRDIQDLPRICIHIHIFWHQHHIFYIFIDINNYSRTHSSIYIIFTISYIKVLPRLHCDDYGYDPIRWHLIPHLGFPPLSLSPSFRYCPIQTPSHRGPHHWRVVRYDIPNRVLPL